MVTDRRLYVGPSLRRLRRDLGLTQADMAADLEVSASYIALLERNHRPLSAEVLLRLAQTILQFAHPLRSVERSELLFTVLNRNCRRACEQIGQTLLVG